MLSASPFMVHNHNLSQVFSDGEITVGLSISLTGRYALQGRQVLQGIQLWQSYVNAQGGIALGAQERRPVRVNYYDDQSRVGRAQTNIRRLIRKDRVDALFGPYSSALTMAAARIAEEQGKVLWNHSGSSDEIFKQGFGHLVSTASPASDYFRDLPSWLASSSPALRRICVLHSARGTFALHVARGVMESAGALGVHSIALVPIGAPITALGALVRNLSSFRPDVVVLAASFEDEVKIVRARHLWPSTVRVVAAVAAGVHASYRELQEKAEGVIGPSQWEPGASPAQTLPDSDWFVLKFKERFGQPPDYTAAGAFAIGIIWAECARQAGTLKDDRLRQTAAELDCNTFYGRFRIDPGTGRQIGHRILLIRWQQGRKALVGGP